MENLLTKHARGLLKQINCDEFVLGIMMVLPAINLLENLNRAYSSIQKFHHFRCWCVGYKSNERRSASAENRRGISRNLHLLHRPLGFAAPTPPRFHNRPKRSKVGTTANHQCRSSEEYFRVQSFKFLDTAPWTSLREDTTSLASRPSLS